MGREGAESGTFSVAPPPLLRPNQGVRHQPTSSQQGLEGKGGIIWGFSLVCGCPTPLSYVLVASPQKPSFSSLEGLLLGVDLVLGPGACGGTQECNLCVSPCKTGSVIPACSPFPTWDDHTQHPTGF